MLANLFGARRDRFTLANLRRLTDVLRVTPASGFSRHTASQVVETFREIAELMIYGDQHDPSFFDAFIEQRVMAHFTKFISPPDGGRPDRDIALQLLQTLAIVVQNVREETSLFFLFSEGHVPRRLVEANLDFDDEEVLGRYVSLLKTTSMRLNARTVQMFFFTGTETRGGKAAGEQSDAVAAAFPLFAAGARFLSHHESMVRAASRTITLNCLAVTDARVRQFLCSPKPWGKCVPRAVEAAGATVAALTEATLFAEPDAPGARERANLVAELGDLLSFVDDAAGLPDVQLSGEAAGSLAERVEAELWSGLVAPTLLGSIAPGPERFSTPGDDSRAPRSLADSRDSRDSRDAGPPQTSPITALFAVSRLAVACRRGSTLARVAADLFGFEPRAGQPGGRRVANARRAFAVRALAGAEGAPVAAAATAAAVSLAKAASDETSPLAAALREVGLAPPRADQSGTETESETETKTETKTESETESASLARAELCDALAAGLARDDPSLPVGARRCSAWLLSRLAPSREGVSETARASLAAATARAAASMRRAVDGPWGDAAATAFAAEWKTTRRETAHPTLRDETAAAWIREAASAASATARREENDDDDDALKKNNADKNAFVRVREESASAAGELLRASRELALLAMLRDATRGASGSRTGPAFPLEAPARLFGDPGDVERAAFAPDSGFAFLEVPPPAKLGGDDRRMEIREGAEVENSDATELRFACRVAFEAGRERAVSLVLAARARGSSAGPPGINAAALLLEALPGANDSGDRSVVRAVAPLGACDAFVDPAHAKWLRVRVRSPFSCLASASSLSSAGGSSPAPPEAEAKRLRKKLRDGHWTLAFADEATCAAARDALDAGATVSRAACRAALAPVLEAS